MCYPVFLILFENKKTDTVIKQFQKFGEPPDNAWQKPWKDKKRLEKDESENRQRIEQEAEAELQIAGDEIRGRQAIENELTNDINQLKNEHRRVAQHVNHLEQMQTELDSKKLELARMELKIGVERQEVEEFQKLTNSEELGRNNVEEQIRAKKTLHEINEVHDQSANIDDAVLKQKYSDLLASLQNAKTQLEEFTKPEKRYDEKTAATLEGWRKNAEKTITEINAKVGELFRKEKEDATELLKDVTSKLAAANANTFRLYEEKLANFREGIETAKNHLENIVNSGNMGNFRELQDKKNSLKQKLDDLDQLNRELNGHLPDHKKPGSTIPKTGADRKKQKGFRRNDGSTSGIIPGGKNDKQRLDIDKELKPKRQNSQIPLFLPEVLSQPEPFVRGHQIADQFGGGHKKHNANSHMYWQEQKQTAIEEELKKQMDDHYINWDNNKVLIKHTAYTEPNELGGKHLPVAKEIRYKVYFKPVGKEPQKIIDEIIPDSYLQASSEAEKLSHPEAINEVKKFREGEFDTVGNLVKPGLRQRLKAYFDTTESEREPIYWEKKDTVSGETPKALRNEDTASGLKGRKINTKDDAMNDMGDIENPTKTWTPSS